MIYPFPELKQVTFVKRYKRFFADFLDDNGETITAHCPNSGSMMGLKQEGARAWLSKSDNPKRKLQYTWELVEIDGQLIGCNTMLPNRLAKVLLSQGLVPGLPKPDELAAEVKTGEGVRLDFMLRSTGQPPCYVEIKNCHLVRTPGLLEFPDSVTARGAKHLYHLASLAQQGAACALLYICQRNDGDRFQIAGDLDPDYAKAAEQAKAAGVRFLALKCGVQKTGIATIQRLKI